MGADGGGVSKIWSSECVVMVGGTVTIRDDKDASERSEKVPVSYHRTLPRASGGECSPPYWPPCSAKTLGCRGKEPLPGA